MTDPRLTGSSASPADRPLNGVDPSTGRFNGASTHLDDHDATQADLRPVSDDDGYGWHAPQTLAPGYANDDASPGGYQQSAEAWWDQIRQANGLGADAGDEPAARPVSGTQPAARPTPAPAPTNGVASGPVGGPPSTPDDATGRYEPFASDRSTGHGASGLASGGTPAAATPVVGGAAADESTDYSRSYGGDYAAAESWREESAARAYPPAGNVALADRPAGRSAGRDTPSATGGVADVASAGPRRARLSLRRVDPWSTLKFSLVLAIALFVVWMVAIGVLYGVLSAMGLFDKINSTVNQVNGSTGNTVTPQLVAGVAAVIGGVSIVLFTALATIGSFIYNLCADMVGGVEVTLAERD